MRTGRGGLVGETADAVRAWESLFRAQVSVMRRLTAEFPSRELSFNEYDVLFNISRQPEGRLRLRDLNQHVLLTQPSVSRLIDRLVARGLVVKCGDESDGRATIVRLTDAGDAAFRAVARVHMESIASTVGGALTQDELNTLRELTDKLRGSVAEA
ncbi:winged helix-turn-helix transcriptional regulator [Clavibacter sp. VKM Ac-2873]|uniref:MarR family winged helix-turn-helix transcriptional regulator n=1 Tax=Clavibacter sp. VKM Ac-2873 TaxID=2783813 RepID=UPI00188B0B8D|nr:MarR family winged helix-turn-helix transcriptional regulator [Clavibacter sp. VKM Ac-2873]MBF4617787.1 winged helix-turn-helix transcriptional regulator [Clavibacter sp. VKM Ac-2873]